jgi:excisionase family DNA binding protein
MDSRDKLGQSRHLPGRLDSAVTARSLGVHPARTSAVTALTGDPTCNHRASWDAERRAVGVTSLLSRLSAGVSLTAAQPGDPHACRPREQSLTVHYGGSHSLRMAGGVRGGSTRTGEVTAGAALPNPLVDVGGHGMASFGDGFPRGMAKLYYQSPTELRRNSPRLTHSQSSGRAHRGADSAEHRRPGPWGGVVMHPQVGAEEAPQVLPAPRIVVTVEEAAEALAVGRTLMYELIASGQVESVLIGRLRRVPADALADYVDRLRAVQRQEV